MAARTEERIGYFLRERNIKYTQSNCFHMELNVLNVCDNMLDMFPPSHPPIPYKQKMKRLEVGKPLVYPNWIRLRLGRGLLLASGLL